MQGSLEACTESLRKLERDDVKLVIVHRGVGGITENDVQLAKASSATIIGFNVRPDRRSRELAETEGVQIRTYEIIYKLIEEIEAAMLGLLSPVFEEVVTGEAEVREVFRVPKIGAIAGLSSVMLVLLYGQSRIFYTMSRDGLLPDVLARVHKRFRTPWINTIIIGIVAAGFAGFMTLDDLNELTSVGSLAAFTIVCVTVIYLRVADPGLKRPFRTPLFPLTPILGTVMCLMLLMALMAVPKTRDFFLIYLGVGLLIYFFYGMRNSKLGRGVNVDNEPLAPMEAPHPEG